MESHVSVIYIRSNAAYDIYWVTVPGIKVFFEEVPRGSGIREEDIKEFYA